MLSLSCDIESNGKAKQMPIAEACRRMLALSFVSGCVAYVTIGIIYLIQDFSIAGECAVQLSLWSYVLVSLVLFFSRFLLDRDDSGIGTVTAIAAIDLSLAVWGSIELFQEANSCDMLYYSKLWDYGLATFIMQLCTTLFAVFLLIKNKI